MKKQTVTTQKAAKKVATVKKASAPPRKTITRQDVIDFYNENGKEETLKRFSHNMEFAKKSIASIPSKAGVMKKKVVVDEVEVTPEGIPLATKVSVKETKIPAKKAPIAAKNTEASELLGKGGKPRGRFDHPDGIKHGDVVELDMKGETVKGVFQYCQRNSLEYGVMLVDGKYAERGLSKFRKVDDEAEVETPKLKSKLKKAAK